MPSEEGRSKRICGEKCLVVLVPQAHDGFQKINMRAGVDLAREPHNRPVLAPDLGPVVDLAAVNIRDLLHGELADRDYLG